MNGLNSWGLTEKQLDCSFYVNDLLIVLRSWKAGSHSIYSVSLNLYEVEEEFAELGFMSQKELEYLNFSTYASALDQFYKFCNLAIAGKIRGIDYEY